MSSTGVSMSVTIDDGITPAIVALARQVRDIDPALDEIGASQVTEVQHRFELQSGPDGKAWVPLAAATLMRRKGSSPRILRDTANLYDSVTHAVKSRQSVIVGTNRVYARIQQLGGKAGRGKRVTIPARPYLGVSEAGQREIIEILKDHLGGT